ncbi:MAG: dTDP-4-dehydrorhamnose 3,5-epimerase family protein [Clostridiales bacterium]|nr:dTDP-4-dehydrorhamnose 3,5-epimerase family protein [Clostridiales bacterium]MCF8022847.1 dTDP-4-dehydrorhamnose 3,5-epimerase family protein [Clostridiales bacterium]
MNIQTYSLLPGVCTYDLNIYPDERGFFSEAFREDWEEFLKGDKIVQANISYNYPGMIRAWHRHLRGQVDYFLVLQGAVKFCAYDDRPDSAQKGNLVEIVAAGQRPQIVRIPGHYWHGTKTVSSEPSLTMYFVNNLYNYHQPDEERRAWNDPSIIDPASGKPFDWNKLPHK